MTLTTTDLFCGAGGSSTGLSAVPGIEVRTAMNHWSRAIETHALNHPEIDHIEADIQVTDPNFIPRTDILWASPECTNHSVAKPTARAMDTVTTVDRHALVTMRGTNAPKHVRDVMDTVTAGGNHHGLMSTQTPLVEDCTFRMLEPHETTWGMAFPRDYVMTGTKRDQVKQAGNSVCPPNARDLGIIGAESLAVA